MPQKAWRRRWAEKCIPRVSTEKSRSWKTSPAPWRWRLCQSLWFKVLKFLTEGDTPMFEFGAGSLWGYPVGGNTATNPTPTFFGTLQDVSLDISGDVKQLYGQKQFPEAVARGK